MRREHSGNIGLPPGNEIGYSTCSQTGEEFSRAFVRTRSSPPSPIPVMRYLGQVPPPPHGARHEDLDGDFDTQRENSVLMDDMNHQSHPSRSMLHKVPDEHQFRQQASSPFHPMGTPASHYAYQTETMKSSFPPKLKLLCSFGGRILPRPTDGKLRYVGGETRIISMRKIHSFYSSRKPMKFSRKPEKYTDLAGRKLGWSWAGQSE